MKSRIFCAIFFFTILSCHKDILDVAVNGAVVTISDKRPIKNASITVICWKYGNSPDESYTEKEVKKVSTDEEGNFNVTFDKGAFIEVKVSSKGYVASHESFEVYQSENSINIKLEKRSK